jgi:hypothetical protein
MNTKDILAALDRQKTLLEDLICISGEQLLLLDNDDLEELDSLLERRSRITIELTAIDDEIEAWMGQTRHDPTVSRETMLQLVEMNHEIVCMAAHIDLLDSAAEAWLDAIHAGGVALRGKGVFR